MWYSQGTITATNNNTVINGVGTAFLQGVRVGDGITIAGSTSLHEVISVASNTQLTIKPAYTGTTGAGKQYAVAPILGYDKDLSDAFNQLRLQFGDKLSGLQPWAHAATASAALDALGFSASGKAVATGSAAQGRAGLGLKSAATRDVGEGTNVVPTGASYGLTGKDFPSVRTQTGLISLLMRNRFLSGASGFEFPSHWPSGYVFSGGPSTLSTYKSGILVSSAVARAGFFVNVTESDTQLPTLYEFKHTGNTSIDSNGFIKSSSPIINLYTDKHDLHNESQFGATPIVTRKSKGVYEITGTLGLRSEGWYLDTPNDRNGNKYLNVEWTQNITPTAVDGIVDEYRDDIVVTIETFERVWNKETGMFDNGAPIDINELQDRFVQLRFNEVKIEHDGE